MAWIDESALTGVWIDGKVWTIGQAGIWIGLPGLRIGVGRSFADGVYADESISTGAWGDS